MPRAPLSVLDLVPISLGADARTALANTVDLARRAEAAGYARYWFAEHHLNPGVAGTSPPIVIAAVAQATERIRVGSGGMQMGHRTALSVVEEFGLLDALFPGRIDLGLGRSGGKPLPRADGARAVARVVDGLVIPEPFSFAALLKSPRFVLHRELLQQPGATAPDYEAQVADVLDLLQGTYKAANGVGARIVPGEGADVDLWILGSSAGPSASAAGKHGLAFAANYHVSPATVLDGIEAYRAAFTPSNERERPHVAVSADVVVADSDAAARELAAGYGAWVRSIRTGSGAIEFPTPSEAAEIEWTDEERDLVADRIETQFVGSPATVVERLETLQRVTGADELVVTTITHDHTDRVRSYELLAQAWSAR